MEDLQQVRQKIDAVDDELTALIVRRLALADEVAAAKRATDSPVADPARERAVLERVSGLAGDEYARGVRAVYAELFELSKARQRESGGEIRGDGRLYGR